MAGLVEAAPDLPDLTPVAQEEGEEQGGPRLVYTFEHAREVGWTRLCAVRSYSPSDGGSPRLVATLLLGAHCFDGLGVWDSRSGAYLGSLSPTGGTLRCLTTYQRGSDDRPRIAAGFQHGCYIWDGDDLTLVHTWYMGYSVKSLAVYEERTTEATRVVCTG
jgi:hypothetical protein